MIVVKRVIPISSNLLTVNRDNWIFLKYLEREQNKHIHLLADLNLHFINFQLNFTEKGMPATKDVRANCFCASLLRSQIHTPRHASSARAKYLNDRW